MWPFRRKDAGPPYRVEAHAYWRVAEAKDLDQEYTTYRAAKRAYDRYLESGMYGYIALDDCEGNELCEWAQDDSWVE